MTLYKDARYAVREALDSVHRRELDSFATPGTWWTGAERAALVEEARDARREAGLEDTEAGEDAARHRDEADLPGTARTVARKVAASPQGIDREFFDAVVPVRLSDAEYVELVGVVARAVNLDVFARGIGALARDVPLPQDGEPSRRRPATAVAEGAWTPTIPSGPDGGRDGADLYAGVDSANILRALSLVPAEARSILDLGRVQYLPMNKFLDFDFTHDPAISRAQVELVAGRVSAINECFY